MWEARAADGQVAQLVAFVLAQADPRAQVYRSGGRVVVIDPTGRGMPEAPAELLARPAQAWRFTAVAR